jgi:hypothetical protein
MYLFITIIYSFIFVGDVYAMDELRNIEEVVIIETNDLAEVETKKKEIFVTDFIKALGEVFKVETYFCNDQIDRPKNKSYIDVYFDNDVQIVSYHRVKNGKFNLERALYCQIARYRRYGPWCYRQIYYVNGKEVDFGDSLKGKEPVYDWVKSHIPDDRRTKEHAMAYY